MKGVFMKITDVLKYKNIEFKNRIVMPPMATSKSDDDGHITDDVLKYYDEKTSSKIFSCVIVEHSYVDIQGKTSKSQSSMASDSDIEGMSKLSSLIKKNGSLAVCQISHAGSGAKKEITGMDIVSASNMENPAFKNGQIAKELSVEEIHEIKDKFVNAAIRAKKAGFDAVEIHSAHAYLLDQFLSPITNKRTDEYGGDVYGRIKLHLEIIRGIKEALGEDYPVFIRMGAGDFMEGGLTEEDSVKASIEFEKAGVDVIDISGGMCFYKTKETYPGFFDTISKPIFDKVNVPVILTGGVTKGTDIVDILDRNVCDLVGIGRSVFKDSNWIEKEVGPLLNK